MGCCSRFAKEVAVFNEENEIVNEGHFTLNEKNEWCVLGCCGDCYVLKDIEYCPFCGAEL